MESGSTFLLPAFVGAYSHLRRSTVTQTSPKNIIATGVLKTRGYSGADVLPRPLQKQKAYHWRIITPAFSATRYDKNAENFLAGLCLAALIWLLDLNESGP